MCAADTPTVQMGAAANGRPHDSALQLRKRGSTKSGQKYDCDSPPNIWDKPPNAIRGLTRGRSRLNRPAIVLSSAHDAASLRLYRPQPAVEGGAAAVRPALGSRDQAMTATGLMLRRDGDRIRAFTKNGHDWADRFLAIVEAAHLIKANSFLIDGEAVVIGERRHPSDFRGLRSRTRRPRGDAGSVRPVAARRCTICATCH